MPFEQAGPSPEDMRVEAKAKAPEPVEEQKVDFIDQAFSDLRAEIHKNDQLEAIGKTAELAAKFDRIMNKMKDAHRDGHASTQWVQQTIGLLESYFGEFAKELSVVGEDIVNKKAQLPRSLENIVSTFESQLDNTAKTLDEIGY